MKQQQLVPPPSVPPGLVVRTAGPRDNEALVKLELETPLLVGGVEETYDRSPDAFACCGPHPGCRTVMGLLRGRPVGVMAGLVHSPVIQGQARRLVYIHRARVHPEFHHHGVAWALSNELFSWSWPKGSTGPYYLIAPANERSIAFGGRGGGRWPLEVALVEYDVTQAEGGDGQAPEVRPGEAARLINETHAGEEFFEPLSVARLRARQRHYGAENVAVARDGGRLVAVAALWDKGATTQRVVTQPGGATTRTRGAVVVDWGYERGYEAAFAELVRGLAGRARTLGRDNLMICEPAPGAAPDIGLPRRRAGLSLFTPVLIPPEREAIAGIHLDLLYM